MGSSFFYWRAEEPSHRIPLKCHGLACGFFQEFSMPTTLGPAGSVDSKTGQVKFGEIHEQGRHEQPYSTGRRSSSSGRSSIEEVVRTVAEW